MMFTIAGAGVATHGPTREFKPGTTQTVTVVTDPVKHLVEVTLDGVDVATTDLVKNLEPLHIDSTDSQLGATSPVTEVATPRPTLCQSLIH
jgi:hypothetical protein